MPVPPTDARPARRLSPRSFGLACLLLAACGCGDSGPELAPVSGVVTLDGKPAAFAEVTFVSERPDGSTSSGITDERGRYRLRFTRDRAGAMLGPHTVRIHSVRPRSDDESGSPADAPAPAKIPRTYGQDSELKAEVKQGNNSLDFDLVTPPPRGKRAR